MRAIKGKVSVILPTYNRAFCLERSVRSVLQQTYENLELIIVDDGSTDCTKDVVASINDARIRYISTKLNQGAAAARNCGLQYVEGEYVAFQDSDDCWRPEKLLMQLKEINGEQAGFCYHKMQCTLDEGTYYILPDEKISLERKSGDIYEQLLQENMVGCPALLVRRECLEEVGGFDTKLAALEDYDFALRLGNVFRASFVNQVLIDISFTNDSVSVQAANYLDASCELLFRYKNDYLATGNFDHRVLRILEDAQRIGMKEHYLNVLMKGIQ